MYINLRALLQEELKKADQDREPAIEELTPEGRRGVNALINHFTPSLSERILGHPLIHYPLKFSIAGYAAAFSIAAILNSTPLDRDAGFLNHLIGFFTLYGDTSLMRIPILFFILGAWIGYRVMKDTAPVRATFEDFIA